METSKSSLSSNVLQMKFMKRSAIRIEQEKNEEERKHVIDDEHWVLDLPETQQEESKYVTEPSYERCHNLMFGRMSFKGFNPEIEKLMVAQNSKLELDDAEQKEKELGVNDEEMAERYESLIGTVRKKFAKKRQHTDTKSSSDMLSNSKSKRTFQKPADD